MVKLFKGFGYAFYGIWTAIKNERNFRIHLVCMAYMYFFLLRYDFFEVSRTQFAIILVANALVLAGELINTSIEACVDLQGEEHTAYGKIAKDTSAAAVLVFAIFAVLVGIAILFQPDAFSKLFSYAVSHIGFIIGFIASVIVFTFFIFFGLGKGGKK
ncbi:MAG: diacylglycerol kinase family protein [Clostridiales bacterium]|nr:diacylglycerol kinase family protein [Clostridiales bacterium]